MQILNRIFLFFFINSIFCDEILIKENITNQNTKNLSELFFDCTPNQEQVSYIYSPGMMASELLMGRFCPEFVASTGEKIKWKSGAHLIGNNFTAVKFSEINLRRSFGFTLNPITAVLNNLRKDLFPLIQRCFEDKFKFKVEDNPKSDLSVVNYSFDFCKANLGQKQDVKALYKTYLKHLKKYPNTNIVLFGDSRGSAATLGFLAKYRPVHVKAAILDAFYDSVPHCIKHFMYADKSPETEKCLHNVISFMFGNYNKKGPFPIDYIKRIDDIPLLFVTSLKDGLTEVQCALNIYVKLKERDFKKIHLLVLDKAMHPCYTIHNPEDTKKYETVVHAFYKKYDLPHNKDKALEGQANFEKAQPTIEEIKKLYNNLPRCELCLF